MNQDANRKLFVWKDRDENSLFILAHTTKEARRLVSHSIITSRLKHRLIKLIDGTEPAIFSRPLILYLHGHISYLDYFMQQSKAEKKDGQSRSKGGRRDG